MFLLNNAVFFFLNDFFHVFLFVIFPANSKLIQVHWMGVNTYCDPTSSHLMGKTRL